MRTLRTTDYLIVMLMVSALFLGGCLDRSNESATRYIPVETKRVGTITGKVLSSRIENNQITYIGLRDAYVYLRGTELNTRSVSEGVYSIENVPEGSYDVVALEFRGGEPEDVKPVTVIAEEVVSVDDLKLIVEPILHGKIFDSDKSTPLGNATVELYRYWREGMWGAEGRRMHSTITLADGSYAFLRTKEGEGVIERFFLKIPEGKLLFFDTNEERSSYIPLKYDLVEKNLYLDPS